MKQIRRTGLRRLGGKAQGQEAADEVAPKAARSTLLYVEDNRDNWEVAQLLLRRRFALKWAQSDVQACEILAADGAEIAAVLMDIELQGSALSGIDLTMLVRGTLAKAAVPPYAQIVPVLPNLPIIFVTGYTARYSESDLLAVGGSSVVTKPVNFAQLSSALGALVGQSLMPSQEANTGAPRPEGRIAQLLSDSPRFAKSLMSFAEAGLFAADNYRGNFGALTSALGPKGITAASMATSVLDIIENHSSATSYLMSLVLRRAIACARIAQHTMAADVHLATALGFMLDAGLLVRAQHDPAGALEIGMSPAPMRVSREQTANEIDHPTRILEVTRGWSLPSELVQAIERHHDPEPPDAPLALVGWAAERVAAVFETGDVDSNNERALATSKPLGMLTKDVEGLLESLPEAVQRLASALGIPIPEQIPYRKVLTQASPALRSLWRSYNELQESSHALLAERLALADRLEEARERVAAAHKKDLEIIGTAQTMFLPRESRVSTDRVELSGFYRSAEECGGDWWWYEKTDWAFRVMVGDVVGHGTSAAMLTGAIAGIVRLVSRTSKNISAHELIEILHQELKAMAKGSYYLTLSVLDIPHSGDVAYWYNAAAPHLVVVTPDGKLDSIACKGSPVGAQVDHFEVERVEIPIPPGTRIFNFTDGLFEFPSVETGQPLNQRGLRRVLQKTIGLPIDQAMDTVVKLLTDLHPSDEPQDDDMTFAIIDIK